MKILVIEDDHDAAATLKDILSVHYTVEVAHTGKEGLYKGKNTGYELIILDLMLGDMNGDEICKELRQKPVHTPILIVTGKSHVADKVTLLNMGADDYITKPFHAAELLARVKALLRRPPNILPSTVLSKGNLVIHDAERKVTYKKEPVHLRRKEFDLLEYLLRCNGQVVTRNMILDHVWGSDTDQFSNTVDVHIKYLRDKLDRRFNVKMIQTVPGIGYKLELS